MSLRLRLALVAALAAAVVGTGAGTARACSNLAFSITTLSVGPGGSVRFTISGTTAGAEWSLSLDGYGRVASGTATGDSVVGTFTAPNLGSTSRTVAATATISHADLEDSPAQRHSSFAYEAPAPPPQQPAPQPAQTSAPNGNTPTPVSQPQPSGGGGPAPGAGPSGPSHGSSPSGRPGPSAPSATPSTPSSGGATTVRAPAVHAAQRGGHGSRSTARPHAFRARVPVRPHKQTAAPQLLPEPMRAHSPPIHRGGAGPVRWLSLSAVLLALAGASAGGAALVLRRRRSPGGAPDAAELELEAELQEMIAEERAKRVPPLPRS